MNSKSAWYKKRDLLCKVKVKSYYAQCLSQTMYGPIKRYIISTNKIILLSKYFDKNTKDSLSTLKALNG